MTDHLSEQGGWREVPVSSIDTEERFHAAAFDLPAVRSVSESGVESPHCGG